MTDDDTTPKIEPVTVYDTPHLLRQALADKAAGGHAGVITGRPLAAGEGWRAVDFVCTCGARDGVAEELHTRTSVSLVLAGTFVCRSRRGSSLLVPGSFFLGSAGDEFECSHQHGEGDRCLSFQFDPALFEEIAEAEGALDLSFGRDSLPPLRALSGLAARAVVALRRGAADLEDLAYELASAAIVTARDQRVTARRALPQHQARVADVIRYMEDRLDERHAVGDLARMAGISHYHFVRTFKQVAGVSPHQWLLRARLRAAAQRLSTSRARITDIALEVGFEDLSNFVRSFRTEFGMSPRQYRTAA